VTRVSPGVVSMLVATAPIMTLVLSRVVLRTQMLGSQTLGVLLGALGVGLIVSPYGPGSGTELAGALLVVGGAMCWATGLVLTRRMPGALGGGRFVAWQLVAGLPLLWPLAIITEGIDITWTLAFVGGVVYSGAIAKGLASVLQYRVVRSGSPIHSSVSAFLVPGVGVVSSWVLLDEPVAPIQLAGGLLVVGAAFVVMRSRADSLVTARPESA
jgi:probable blue pigment (indigoidine) exporter